MPDGAAPEPFRGRRITVVGRRNMLRVRHLADRVTPVPTVPDTLSHPTPAAEIA